MAKYGGHRNGWDLKGPDYRSSGIWKGIINVKEIFLNEVRFRMGSGERIFFLA